MAEEEEEKKESLGRGRLAVLEVRKGASLVGTLASAWRLLRFSVSVLPLRLSLDSLE